MVARDDVFSCIFLVNEERFRTPESSKSQGRLVWIYLGMDFSTWYMLICLNVL